MSSLGPQGGLNPATLAPSATAPGVAAVGLGAPPAVNWSNVQAALDAAPDIQGTPGLASAAITQPGTAAVSTAVTLARANHVDAAVQVHSHAHATGILGDLGSAINFVRTGVWDHLPGHTVADSALLNPVATVAGWANKPLQEVQHEYRYVRDVWTHHGAQAGLVTLLGGVGGALIGGAAGSLVGETAVGATLGSEAALGLEGHFLYHDSWNRSATEQVSLGRDIAGLIPVRRHSVVYDVVSGLVDGSFDLAADPLNRLGGALAGIRSDTMVVTSAEDFNRIAEGALAGQRGYGPARRAFTQIAQMDSPTQIANRFPPLRNLDTAEHGQYLQRLAAASTPEDVVGVLRDALTTEGWQGTRGMPVMSITRLPFAKAADAMWQWQLPRGLVDEIPPAVDLRARAMDFVSRRIQRFANHPAFTIDAEGDLSGREFADNDPNAARALYYMVRTGNSEPVARGLADALIAAQGERDFAQVHNLWHNGIIAAMVGRGLPADTNLIGRLKG